MSQSHSVLEISDSEDEAQPPAPSHSGVSATFHHNHDVLDLCSSDTELPAPGDHNNHDVLDLCSSDTELPAPGDPQFFRAPADAKRRRHSSVSGSARSSRVDHGGDSGRDVTDHEDESEKNVQPKSRASTTKKPRKTEDDNAAEKGDAERKKVQKGAARAGKAAGTAASTFPMLSPLLAPRALSPVLAPTNWSNEREPTALPFDPSNLCAYCDGQLPNSPSDILIDMGKRLFLLSELYPLPDNPLHRRVPQIGMTTEYCARHRFESNLIPQAMAAGWPFKPDFTRLFRRVLDLGPRLRSLCKGLEENIFYLGAQDYYRDNVAQRSSLMNQLLSDRVPKHGAGFYGERGYLLFDLAIHIMFPDTAELRKTFHPLTYDIAIREILIPQAVTHLIQEDLNIGHQDAMKVIERSYTFGIILHPSDDDCEFHMAAIRSISKGHTHAQRALPGYEASGSTVGLEECLENQKDLELAGVIDLTNDD